MKLIKTFLLLTLLGSWAIPVQADDTDLYLDPNSSIGSEPLVMISLDYRSNLGSTICSSADTTSCPQSKYFRDANPIAAGETTNTVHSILDARVSNSDPLTFFDILRLSLITVFGDLSGVKVGLMMSHANENNCVGPDATKCSNGGYILQGFKLMEEGDPSGNKQAFFDRLESIPVPQGNLSHNFQGKELYFELFRFLTGQGVYNGHNAYTDFGTNNAQNLDQDFPAASWDTAIEKNTAGGVTNYVSPLEAESLCSKIFVINFMFQTSSQDSDSDSAITAGAANGGMGDIDISGKRNSFDTVIEWMRTRDLADGTFGDPSGTGADDVDGVQSVISYFVVRPNSINTTTQGYASAGGTNEPLPLEDDPQKLVSTISKIFKEILSVSTTFVAASVPVNVFNRSQSLDSVYLALFEADSENKPFWPGNLKKLRVETDFNSDGEPDTDADGNPIAALVDANKNLAIANNDGRIKFDALTFWTMPGSLPPPEPDTEQVAGADGRVVERGGAGQKIPGFISPSPELVNGAGGRKLLYDPAVHLNGGTSSLLPFNANTTTASALLADMGLTDTGTAERVIAHARGLDVRDADADGITDEARSWILGDPLHSRPLPFNYGNLDDPGKFTNNPDIYIAMSTNDGFMHFFRDTDASGNSNTLPAGEEVWGFMPRNVMDKLPSLYANSIDFGHPYTVDGPPSAFLLDQNQDGTIDDSVGDRAILYFGLRRGGSSYYALDVSDPETPKLLWRINRTTGGDFDELGQSWSQARVGLIDTDGTYGPNPTVPVIVITGGYDTNKDKRDNASTVDVDEGLGTADSVGNAIYVVNALTGDLIWKATGDTTATGNVDTHAEMTDSIPSDIAVVDTDGDGYLDRGYVGDTGGKVWRIDIAGAVSNWKVSLLATLGSDSDRSADRRFFHAPDVVQSKDGPGDAGKFDAVILGSGDRANPLDRPIGSVRPDNYLFVLKDRNTQPNSSTFTVPDTNYQFGDLLDVSDFCLLTGTESTCDPGDTLTNGWKFKLNLGFGEKNLSSPLTVANQIFATTYLPLGTFEETVDPTEKKTCGPSEGKGILYTLALANGLPVQNYNTTNDTTDADGNEVEVLDETDAYTEVGSDGIPAGAVAYNTDTPFIIVGNRLQSVGKKNTWRTYWYKLEDKENY